MPDLLHSFLYGPDKHCLHMGGVDAWLIIAKAPACKMPVVL